jgi:hypothetical protein
MQEAFAAHQPVDRQFEDRLNRWHSNPAGMNRRTHR